MNRKPSTSVSNDINGGSVTFRYRALICVLSNTLLLFHMSVAAVKEARLNMFFFHFLYSRVPYFGFAPPGFALA